MRKLNMLSVVFICPLLIIAGFNEANAAKVLVNIWDGTKWKKIRQLFYAGQLPNAERVSFQLYKLTGNNQCFSPCDCNNCCMKTTTKPQHATMLTGVLADEHGVFYNKCYQMIPDGLTVYEKIESKDSSIKTAHISSKPGNFGEATFGNIIEDVDYFFTEPMPPRAAANQARRLIREWCEQDFFIVCYFRYPDVKGHKYGVDSEEYEEAILTCDSELGRILDRLASYGILEETKIYTLSDHGFGNPTPRGHENAPNTFIISNDGGMTDISMDQVAGFLLANFGLEP
jgi:hypothetical protein